jgi:hypothetical protein
MTRSDKLISKIVALGEFAELVEVLEIGETVETTEDSTIGVEMLVTLSLSEIVDTCCGDSVGDDSFVILMTDDCISDELLIVTSFVFGCVIASGIVATFVVFIVIGSVIDVVATGSAGKRSPRSISIIGVVVLF